MPDEVSHSVRKLESHDHSQWSRLRHMLWPAMSTEQNKRECADILANPDKNVVFVCVLEKRLIGYIEVSLRERAEGCHTRPIGYIEGWGVEAEFRGQGAGSALIQAVENWAREHGCTEMASDVELNNAVSQKAHTSLGYQETHRLIHYKKDLTVSVDS